MTSRLVSLVVASPTQWPLTTRVGQLLQLRILWTFLLRKPLAQCVWVQEKILLFALSQLILQYRRSGLAGHLIYFPIKLSHYQKRKLTPSTYNNLNLSFKFMFSSEETNINKTPCWFVISAIPSAKCTLGYMIWRFYFGPFMSNGDEGAELTWS